VAADSADFYLRLHEQVNAPARKAEAAVRRLSGGLIASRQELARTELALRKHFAAQQKGQGKNSSIAGSVFGGTIAAHGVAALTGAAAAATAAVAGLAVSFATATARALDFGQRSRLAFSSLMGDKALGHAEFDFVRTEAQRLGLDIEDTTDDYRKLLAAQFEVGQARELLRASADMQALGATADDVKGILRAISQIKMKGVLQAEELTGQLADRGISAELVYQDLEKRLGKSRKEILAMQKNKEITSEFAIPAIVAAIKKKANEENVGDVATKFASTKISGMLAQMKGAVKNTLIDIGSELEAPTTALVARIFEDFKSDLPEIKNTLSVVAGEMFFLLSSGADQAKKDLGGIGGVVRGLGEAFFFVEGSINSLIFLLQPLKVLLAGVESIAFLLQGDFKNAKEAASAFITGRSDVSRWNVMTGAEFDAQQMDLNTRAERLKIRGTTSGLENRGMAGGPGAGGKVVNIGTLNQNVNVDAVDHKGDPSAAGDEVGKAGLKQFLGALETA
jgi:tape measure domain-containing protein